MLLSVADLESWRFNNRYFRRVNELRLADTTTHSFVQSIYIYRHKMFSIFHFHLK